MKNTDARVLVEEDDRVLLVLEKGGPVDLPDGKSFEKEPRWGMPGGRNKLGDEDAVDTALRETKEETGLSVYINEKLMVDRQMDGFTKVVFTGYFAGGKIKINPEEILDCRWFSKSVLYDPGFNMYFHQRQMAQELLRLKESGS